MAQIFQLRQLGFRIQRPHSMRIATWGESAWFILALQICGAEEEIHSSAAHGFLVVCPYGLQPWGVFEASACVDCNNLIRA